MNAKNVDVIIVGLGPTGAALAGLLGQRGLRVAAFDKLPTLYPLPRAIGLDHEAMRVMQELGVADKVFEHVAPYRPSEYRGMDGQLIKRLDMAPPPYRLGWAPNYVFNQPAFEAIIRERLAELESVQTYLASEVIASGQDGRGAWVDVKLGAGESETRFTCQYLVACDGGGSPIRTRMGIELEDLDFHEPWLVVDAIINDKKLAELPQTQVQYCEASRPSTFVILPGNHRRWEIMLLPGDSLSPDFPHEELWPLLERWIVPADGKLWRAAAYRFHGLVAKEWRRDRILLAGDAAHMTPPFMAQGMVQGLRDAQNLAWKLDLVLKDRAFATLLDSYADERRPHVLETTRRAIELGRVICERNPTLARQRDERLLAEHGGQVPTTIRQNMIPDLLPGSLITDTPGAGSLAPQPNVRHREFVGRLDDLTGPGLRAVVAGPLAPALEASFLKLLERSGGTLVHVGQGTALQPETYQVKEQDPVLGSWLEKLGQSVAIVRPDNYVFGTAISHLAGVYLLEHYLSQLDIASSSSSCPPAAEL